MQMKKKSHIFTCWYVCVTLKFTLILRLYDPNLQKQKNKKKNGCEEN